MIKIIFNEEDISALRYWRFQHPDPQVRAHGSPLLAQSRRGQCRDPAAVWDVKASFHRHLKAYMAGGITQLKRIDHYRPHSELANHRTTLEAYFHQHPPATVAEAAAKIAELTGIVRKPTRIRQYLQALGMKPMKVGMLPAKADVKPKSI